ncbi:MAG: hypothetical protein DWQ01_16480 [Planctomycetota bacterium]|nr:MAG: hypothetical protein DWQ01_16480 [Planctomycetota bacterium]
MNDKAKPFWSAYAAGVGLGLVLLASFLLTGDGLGASGGFGRIALTAGHALAPEHVEALPHAGTYFEQGPHILKDNLIFVILGMALGGFLSALAAGRARPRFIVERGPTASRGKRLAFAVAGGILMGFAARLARGCTSGQALSGGAMLALGSWAFMFAVFAGGFAAAYFVRRQWQ